MIMLHRVNYLKHDIFTLTYNKFVNIYIVCKIILWSNIHGADFALGNSLFGLVKLTQNAHPKYKYSDVWYMWNYFTVRC